jgi:hypothetical protein
MSASHRPDRRVIVVMPPDRAYPSSELQGSPNTRAQLESRGDRGTGDGAPPIDLFAHVIWPNDSSFASSMSTSRLYFATRSPRAGAPLLI